MAGFRWRSAIWIIGAIVLAYGGAVGVFAGLHGDLLPTWAMPFTIAALVIGLAGCALAALRYWRAAYLRQLEKLFLPQADGSYFAGHVHGVPRRADVYRIDRQTRDAVLNGLVNGMVIETSLLMIFLFALIAGMALKPWWFGWRPALGLVLVVLLMRRINGQWGLRRTTRIITGGTLLPDEKWPWPVDKAAGADASRGRLILLAALVVIAIGLLGVAFLFAG